MAKEYSIHDLKYLRYGYVPDGRVSDTMITVAMRDLPGDGFIYPVWRYNTKEHFLENNAFMGPVLWANCASNHTLFINGFHIIRMWTNTRKSCIVDVCEALKDGSEEEIPESCNRKSKPLKHRIRLTTVKQAEQLFNRIKRVYGV